MLHATTKSSHNARMNYEMVLLLLKQYHQVDEDLFLSTLEHLATADPIWLPPRLPLPSSGSSHLMLCS